MPIASRFGLRSFRVSIEGTTAMKSLFALTPVVCLMSVAIGRTEDGTPAPALILFPRPDAVVAENEELEGKVADGWPVIFIRPNVDGGMWWAQKPIDEVIDGAFSVAIHVGDEATLPGTEFSIRVCIAKSKSEAAQYKAGRRMNTLPIELKTTEAISVFRDVRPTQPGESLHRRLEFSGRQWFVKSGNKLGPHSNVFSDSDTNVFVDAEGALHLVIDRRDNQWRCAEIMASESLGYGEYRWIVAGDFAGFDRQAVLGLFTYETTLREIDFELSKWGIEENENAQFVVQPHTKKSNIHRFDTGNAKVLTCSLEWSKTQVRGRCWTGEDITGDPLVEWKYTGRSIPPPGKERVRANLWLLDGKAPTTGTTQEMIVRKFEFRPMRDQ
jgi:hypothetical protein